MPTVTVLLTCHNRRSKTLTCLAALHASRLPDGVSLRVVLVDDGSTDGTAEAVQHCYPQVEVIRGDGSLFWNRGMHRALAHATKAPTEYYLWLNDDTELFPDALAGLMATADLVDGRQGRPGIVVGSTRDPATGEATYGGRRLVWWRPLWYELVHPSDAPIQCDTMNGNCVLIPGAVVRGVGNLDPTFTHAMGDYDYGLRVSRAGSRIWVMPGYAGICARNPPPRPLPERQKLAQRWRKVVGPKGMPMREWYTYTRRHAGPAWVLYWLKPYAATVFSHLLSKLTR